MSPELINSRNGAKGYDGKQVDVWASGVLLIVMLLGTFPFDHTENPDPNTSEAHLEVWCGRRAHCSMGQLPCIFKWARRPGMLPPCPRMPFLEHRRDRRLLQHSLALLASLHTSHSRGRAASHVPADVACVGS